MPIHSTFRDLSLGHASTKVASSVVVILLSPTDSSFSSSGFFFMDFCSANTLRAPTSLTRTLRSFMLARIATKPLSAGTVGWL
jgi:hypothetical protein